MRPTTPTRAIFHNTTPALARRTPTLLRNNERGHYIAAYLRVHDNAVTEVTKPGTQDDRSRYWWRRAFTFLMGNQRQFYKDNVFPGEQAIVFKDPVPGGHGDRFTHSFIRFPGPNHKAKYALHNWEMRNLTPEQLAVKYGVYIPRPRPEDVFAYNTMMFLMWLYLFYMTYYDNDLAFVTHPVLDDFVKEMGGVVPLAEEEAYQEQWVHPYYHNMAMRKADPHWSYKPMVMYNVKTEST